jgi:hypothetical protein
MLHNLLTWLKIPLCWVGIHDWWWMSHTMGAGQNEFECSRCQAQCKGEEV